MLEEPENYLPFLKPAIDHTPTAAAFARAAAAHRALEHDFNSRVNDACPVDDALTFPHIELSPQDYWQRNFFSILFLSIFETMGIATERRHRYGMLLHAIRGIVTATDNILDDEGKGSVRLQLEGGKVLPNVLVILMESGILHDLVQEITAGNGDYAQRTWKGLMQALFMLGREESGEEQAIEKALPPATLMDQVHRFRGGGLLQLAFIAPQINEPQLAGSIATAMSAVNHIGLALQILDDVTDFSEDLKNRNHNMLRSYIVHCGPDGACTDAELKKLDGAACDQPETRFPKATADTVMLAVNMALAGFDHLSDFGHPVNREAATRLIRAMFALRGLSRLWDLYLREHEAVTRGQRAAIDHVPYMPNA